MTKKPLNSLTEASLAALDAKLLAHFIFDYAQHDPALYEAAANLVRYNEEPSGIYKDIIKRIKRISTRGRFYDRRGVRDLDYEVFDILRSIREDLASHSVEEAVFTLQYFVECASEIIESVDTSDGTVYPHLQEAVKLLGHLWGSIPGISSATVAEYVRQRILNNGYGVFDFILDSFKETLGKTGLRALERLLRADAAKLTDKYSKEQIIRQLRDIADIEKDVDKYLALQVEFPSGYPEHAHLQAAKRLSQAGRAKEALERMRYVKPDTIAWRDDIDSTLLRCYELLGRADDMFQLLESRFLESPSEARLEQLLKVSGGGRKNRERFIDELASKGPRPEALLDFFVEIKDIKRLAALVLKNHERWDGNEYYSLAPAAKLLEDLFPLEATILYRSLLDSLLSRANSKYYHHAARYWSLLIALESRIRDYAPICSHYEYCSLIREAHRRKSAFWSAVSDVSN